MQYTIGILLYDKQGTVDSVGIGQTHKNSVIACCIISKEQGGGNLHIFSLFFMLFIWPKIKHLKTKFIPSKQHPRKPGGSTSCSPQRDRGHAGT